MSLEVLGDRWSLLIIRDMMVRGYRTFREFQHAGEGIATNILADRLRRLEASGILTTEPVAEALAPVLLDLLIWAAQHEETAAPCSFIAQMAQNREAVLAETYRRWEQRDPTPLIPPFSAPPTFPGDTPGVSESLNAQGAPKSRRASKPKSSPKGKLRR
jgi:hypothetical protein